jgi:hypothetical protein
MSAAVLHLKTCSTFSRLGKYQNTTFRMRMEMSTIVRTILIPAVAVKLI